MSEETKTQETIIPSPHRDEDETKLQISETEVKSQNDSTTTVAPPSLEKETEAQPEIVSVWGKTSAEATPSLVNIQQEQMSVAIDDDNSRNIVVEFEKKMSQEANFEIIPDSKTYIWQYKMTYEMYTMSALKFEESINDYVDEKLKPYISPWWYCIRDDVRPKLPILLPLLCQTHHWKYLGPPPHYTIHDLRGLIKRNQVSFAPRYKDEMTPDFTTFFRIKKLLDFTNEKLDIYTLARHAAYMMYDFHKDSSAVNLWNALSTYLGVLMYPFKYYFFSNSDMRVFLSSPIYLWNEMCNMGSNLLYGLSKCTSRFEPRYIMANSWWGSQVIGMYGWTSQRDKTRQPIKLIGRVPLLSSSHEADLHPRDVLDIRKAAKIVYGAPDDERKRIAESYIKNYGFDIGLLFDLVKFLDTTHGKFPPTTKLSARELFGKQRIPGRRSQSVPRNSRQRSPTKTNNRSIPKSFEKFRRSSSVKQDSRSRSVTPRKSTQIKNPPPKQLEKKSNFERSKFKFRNNQKQVRKVPKSEPLVAKRFTKVYLDGVDIEPQSKSDQPQDKPSEKPAQPKEKKVERSRAPLKKEVQKTLTVTAQSKESTTKSDSAGNRRRINQSIKKSEATQSEKLYNVIVDFKPMNTTITTKSKNPMIPSLILRNVLYKTHVDSNPSEFSIIVGTDTYSGTSKTQVEIGKDQPVTILYKGTGGSQQQEPQQPMKRSVQKKKTASESAEERRGKLFKIAKKYAGHGIPIQLLVSANYEAGRKSHGVYNDENINSIDKLAVQLARLPESPFPKEVGYIQNGKLNAISVFIDSQFQHVPECDWSTLPKSKVTPEQLEFMKPLFKRRKRNKLWLCAKNFDMKHKFEVYTLNPTTSEMYEAAFNVLQDHTRQDNRFIGERYLNKAIVTDTVLSGDTHRVTIDVLYNGPSLMDGNGKLNLTHDYDGAYVPSNRTNGHAKINYDMVGLLGLTVNTLDTNIVAVYDDIADNSVGSYKKQQIDVQRIVAENIKCPGTISGQLVRFAQCMFTRKLACKSEDDHCWVSPIESLRFYPLFDLRTMTPGRFGNLYITYPQVKVNMKASTGIFCNNQPRDLLCKISDGDLCAQWFTLMNEAIKKRDNNQLNILKSLALEAEMKPKDEVFERQKMFYKTRTIYVLNSFTQVPLNVMFTGAENEFMSSAMADITEPVLLGIDPVLWIKNLIITLREKPEVFSKQRFWYYSYSDNVYCLDAKEMLLYSFDGTKMESSIRGEDVVNLLSTISNYVGVADFEVVGDESVINEAIHRCNQYDTSTLQAYQFKFDFTATYSHTPFALDGRSFKISSYYDRMFLNSVIFYVKPNIKPFKYEEDTAKFSVIGVCENYQSVLWNTYVQTMGQLCENLQCYLGETMIESHFLPSGAQFTSLVNTYKTLGSVLFANANQVKPENFTNIVKCWVVELENVADLKPIVHNDHTIENIRLDFLGMDATCTLGYWSVILRESALYSGPCYGDYIAKQRDLRVLNNEFAMYCAALLNGVMNRPYYCTLILDRLFRLSSRITLNKELIEEMSASLSNGLELEFGDEFFNSDGFWPYFIKFCIDRLKLEEFDKEDLLIDSICGVLQPPKGELSNDVTKLEKEIEAKYGVSTDPDYLGIINQFIVDEDIPHKLTPENGPLMDRIATLAKLIGTARSMYYSKVVQIIAAAALDLVKDDLDLSTKIVSSFSEVLYT